MKPRIAVSVALSASLTTVIGLIPAQASSQPELRSAIVFTSTRSNPDPDPVKQLHASDLYLMLTTLGGAPDPTQTFRLTQNATAEGFAALSPDGKRIVFDSNRLTNPDKANSSDLFVMSAEDIDQPVPDQEQKHLTRGSSASWAPHGPRIAFHASQSGDGVPIKTYAGAETIDSDIFTMNVNDCLEVIELNHVNDCRDVSGPHVKNITNNGSLTIDDADWSPDGTRIVYVPHAPTAPPMLRCTC